jgi:hypothetical protein
MEDGHIIGFQVSLRYFQIITLISAFKWAKTEDKRSFLTGARRTRSFSCTYLRPIQKNTELRDKGLYILMSPTFIGATVMVANELKDL